MKKILIWIFAAFFIAGCSSTGTVKISSEPFDIAMTGDIMTGRRYMPVIEEKGPDYPFEHVRDYLKSCRVVFGNLEAPLIYEGKIPQIKKNGKKRIHLYAKAETAQGLKNAGFNIISLGNNHSIDYGQQGVTQTIEILEKQGIEYCGLRRGGLGKANPPLVKEVNSTKVGFLCYSNVSHKKFAASADSYGTIPGLLPVFRQDIKSARKDVDVLIVYIHWGKEWEPVREKQYRLARKIIDMGADLIAGSHTHIFQDIEVYKGKYIFYGLGNFVFDLHREEAKYSAIVKIRVKNRSIEDVSIQPVYLKDYRPAPVKDRQKLFDFLSGIKLINLSVKDIYKGGM